ncbi:MAG: hypothetical protein ABJZ55_23125, partial [Fuerstiella sp.]
MQVIITLVIITDTMNKMESKKAILCILKLRSRTRASDQVKSGICLETAGKPESEPEPEPEYHNRSNSAEGRKLELVTKKRP